MKGFGDKKTKRKRIVSNENKNANNEKLIKKAFQLQAKGEKIEAAKYYLYLIKNGVEDYRVFSNYGAFLKEIGKYKEAEIELKKAIKLNPKYANAYFNIAGLYISKRKFLKAEIYLRNAIEIKSDFAIAHYNLGFILQDQGKLQEAKSHIRNSLEIEPQLTNAYWSLSTLPETDRDQKWQNQLFSKSILKNKNNTELVNIFFARANILHKKSKYKESAENLSKANNLKLSMYKSEANILIKKTNKLKISSNNFQRNYQIIPNYPICIFIVGLPRCGSTLVESILSLNSQVSDLGEVNIFEESYREYIQADKKVNLADIYKKKTTISNNKSKITTNKWLFNYQYAGIILNAIPNAKIIHCYRNPLDNILSIYRAHFTTGNSFSSSLIDCAEVYSNQEEIMKTYKQEFRSKIYDLNYDELVTNPLKEIKSLIKWLNWEWNDTYLSPHLNKRSVFTRSNVEIRSPISSKSVGGWENYKDMLKPAFEILFKKDKYKNL